MDTNKILIAQKLAHDAHDSIQQKRKYTGEPYWVHTDEVAEISAQALIRDNETHIRLFGDGKGLYSDEEITDAVCAAHLHDFLEDVVTELTLQLRRDELVYLGDRYKELGQQVHVYVTELTDVFVKESYPNLNRKERKNRELERIATISSIGKTVKLADLKSNTKSIVEHDKDFANLYIREKLALLPFLVDGESILYKEVMQQANDAAKILGLLK